MKRNYPVGIQNFEEIRKENYFYIDKTAQVFKLVESGKYYFLSRPRRFGKSLLISTLEAYFQGKKELFEGLANTEKYDTPQTLENKLSLNLKMWEDEYGANEYEYSLATRFEGVIRRAAEKWGRNVVILIDEYDKPMLQAIGNETLLTDYRNTLKAFYGVMKSCDRYIKFALLTGVTKFSKVSVFSDLNNLMDISIDERFASLCGITEEELFTNFQEDIIELGQENKLTEEETKAELKKMYDGYHFAEESEDIYNPFSLLNTFAKMRFGSYWFETGTPTFLVELLKHSRYDLHRLTEEMASADSLGGIDTMHTNPVPILYQSGYLTIKGYDREFQVYYLGFPNKEVEEGFTKFLLPRYAYLETGNPSFEIMSFVKDVRQGDADAFLRRLQSFFADSPYELARDEYHTANGRIDMVVKTDKYIYVMEFKLDGTAEEALQQINNKQYALPFASDSRKLFKIGVNFSKEKRGIEGWIVED